MGKERRHSTFSARLLRWLWRFLWYGFSTLAITLAVIVTLARVLLPVADGYRERVEAFASDQLGQPVEIRGLEAHLLGFAPTVVLKEVALHDPSSEQPTLELTEIRLGLDPLASLHRREVVLDQLTIVGADLTLERLADGSLRLTGGPETSPAGNTSPSQWLLSQGRLAIKESRLLWRDAIENRSLLFSNVDVELRNDGRRHRLTGSVGLPKEMGKSLQVALDVEGDPLLPLEPVGGLVGELYLKGEDLRPAAWDYPLPGPVTLSKGYVDLEMWGRWSEGRMSSLQGTFALRDATFLGVGKRSLSVENASGYLAGEWHAKGWNLQLQQLSLDRKGERFTTEQLRLESGAEGLLATASSLPVAELALGLALSPGLEPQQRQWLEQVRPRGELSAVRVELAEGRLKSLQCGVRRLQLDPWGSSPGVAGVDGQLTLDGQGRAEIGLVSAGARLELPGVFRTPLELNSLRGAANLSYGENGWRLRIPELLFSNNDLTGRASLELSGEGDGTPFIDFYGEIADGQANSIARYLPMQGIGQGARRWLSNAFLGGTVTSGRVLLHGSLGNFPFRGRKGKLQVELEAEGVDLAFHPDWPSLKGIDGRISIDGAGVRVVSDSALMLQSALHHTVVKVPFNGAPLTAEAEGELRADDLLVLLTETPLAQQGGQSVAFLRGSGPTALKLNLTVPLKKSAGQKVVAVGELRFQGSRLQAAPGLVVEGLKGKLAFNESGLQAPDLAGRLFGYPLKLSLQAPFGGELQLAMQGRAGADTLRAVHRKEIFQKMEGEAAWQALVTARSGSEALLHITSDLRGMALHLPEPFAKEQAAALPLEVTAYLAGSRSGRIAGRLGELVAVNLERDPEGNLSRAAIHFGSAAPQLPPVPLIRLSGSLDRFSPAEWIPFLPASTGRKRLPIELKMERLGFRTTEKREAGVDRPKDWPPLRVNVNHFDFNGVELGHLQFRSEPQGMNIRISDLVVDNPTFRLSGSGGWRADGRAGETLFDLNLTAEDVSRMMESLGVVSVITRGRIRVDGSLYWPGSPADAALEKLNGQIALSISRGLIEEVDPGAGRLLGLLSLRALPRRLFLDFSDFSSKGMGFDRIEGDVRLEQGNAYTTNLRMEAVPANVLITGRTGLVNQDYEQLVTVVPNVSDSLPVAGGLAWGPQVGALLLVLQGIFQDEIDQAAMTRYSITGKWAEPVIERLDDKAEDSS